MSLPNTTSNSDLKALRNKVAIVGVGESEIGKVPNMSGLGLNAQAAMRALGFQVKKAEVRKMIADIDKDETGCGAAG